MTKSELYLSKDFIQAQVAALSKELSRRYSRVQSPVTVIGILDGCYHFVSDVTKQLSFNHQLHFVKTNSYQKNVKTDDVKWLLDVEEEFIKDHFVIILDTIIDSGVTLERVMDRTLQYGPKSVISACLIERAGLPIKKYKPSLVSVLYSGPEFFYGYGMDNYGKNRHIKEVRIII